MKKKVLVVIVSLCIMLTGCGKIVGTTGSATPEPATSKPVTPEPATSKPAADDKDGEIYAGWWHSMNAVAAGFGERYALNGDGTFVYAASQMGEFERELFKTGTWSVSRGELKLQVEARFAVPVGDIKDIVPSGDLVIFSQGVVKAIYNPPEVETYSIAKADADPETGKAIVVIDGMTFYDFNNQTDLFDDFNNLINSENSSWGDPGELGMLQWWGEFKSDDLGFSIALTEYSGTDFWVKIYLLRDGHTVIEGRAEIDAEDEHLAIFEDAGIGLYLYEDFSAIDILASEDSEWEHMRGKYTRIE